MAIPTDEFIEVQTAQSLWLIDEENRRFQRCASDEDVDHVARFGTWRPLERYRIDDGVLLVKPTDNLQIRAKIVGVRSRTRAS